MTSESRATVPFSVTPNLDSVRGLACLLVVALHVVGDLPTNGLHLPMTSPWHYAMSSIEFLRIPLFTAMSGYLYAGRRVSKADFALFWTKKARRLGVPLIFVTTISWMLHEWTYGDTTTLPEALFFSFGHLWYVQSLILIFAAISIADAFFRPTSAALVVVGLAAIMLAQSGMLVSEDGVPITQFFSVVNTLYLAPHFLFGMILREHQGWLRERQWGTTALWMIGIVLTAQQLGMNGLANEVTLMQLPAAIVGMACVVFLMQRLPSNKLLASIGVYSYTIYLWHIIPSAAVRTVLIKVGVESTAVRFAFCFVAAVIAPIITCEVARRIPLLSVAMTGENRRPFLAKLAKA
jgi:peptidoglycan/LPS O-acetylase OafA/YrhL